MTRPFSFQDICEVLQIDAPRLRRALLRWAEPCKPKSNALKGSGRVSALHLLNRAPKEHPDFRAPSSGEGRPTSAFSDAPITLSAAFPGETADSSPVSLWSELERSRWSLPEHTIRISSLCLFWSPASRYTALDLSAHVGPARGFARRVWLAAAALTMGGGIWSMHFVGMLAFIMPTPMSYDIGLTILSLVVAIFVTGGGFYVISWQSASPLRLVLSGTFMGLGIAGMHYTGMAAMRGHFELSYDPLFVALSLVIAIGASTVALWLAFRTTDLGQKLVAAVVMGLAVSGMHYTGMRAAIFTAHGPLHEAQVNAGLDQTNLALVVAGITFVILAFASVASLIERQRAEEALRQAQANLAR